MENSFKFQKGDIIARDPLHPVEGEAIIKFSVLKSMRDHIFESGMAGDDNGWVAAHKLVCEVIDEYLDDATEKLVKGQLSTPADDEYQGRYKCINCGHQVVWQSDFNYDEVHGEGEGVVSYWHCPHCGAMHEVSVRTDNEEE